MIYLIDDNQNDLRARIGADFVDEGVFDGYLTAIDKLEKKAMAVDTSHLEFLKSADCILLHASTEDWSAEKGFLSGSLTNVRKIREDVADFGDSVPLVLFSNGMENTVFHQEISPNYVQELNKTLFYSRLFDFMEHYKNENKVELRILTWGKNFLANEIGELAKNLLAKIAFNDDSEVFEMRFIEGEEDSFDKFIRVSYPDETINNVMDSIISNSFTVSQFREKINSISESFFKYGKNIYPWQ